MFIRTLVAGTQRIDGLALCHVSKQLYSACLSLSCNPSIKIYLAYLNLCVLTADEIFLSAKQPVSELEHLLTPNHLAVYHRTPVIEAL